MNMHAQIVDPSGRGQTLERLGNAYRDLEDPDRAEDYYQQALALWRDIRHGLGEGRVLNGLGELSSRLGLHDQAISRYGEALEAHRSIEFSEGVATTLLNLGRSLVHVGRIREGRACWCEASELFEMLGDPRATQAEALIQALDVRPPPPDAQ
jgi:tetratricopeptide (TPR) repeat protein